MASNRKMKLEDLQPKAPELTVPRIEKVDKAYWKPLLDMVNHDLPQMFIRLKDAISFISSIQNHITDSEALQSINVQAGNIVKDAEPLMAKWQSLKTDIEEKTNTVMMPEEALALSFTYQTELQQWAEEAAVIISTPLDNLLDYCTSKLNFSENPSTENTND